MKTRDPKKAKVSLSTLSLQVEQAERKATEAKEGVRRAKARLRSSRKALKHARKEAKHARRSAKEMRKEWERVSAQAVASATPESTRKKHDLKPASTKRQAPVSKPAKRTPSARGAKVTGGRKRPAATVAKPSTAFDLAGIPGAFTASLPGAEV
jgi:chromosome segregation ATPase